MIRSLSVGIVLAGLSACTSAVAPAVTPPAEPVKSPFRLVVDSESFSGELLTVRATVLGEVPWDPETLAVRLQTYKNDKPGGVLEGVVATLATESPSKTKVDPQQPYPVALSVRGQELTDYQVELLWGAEAAPVIARTGNHGVLALEAVQVAQEASTEGQPPQFKVSGMLTNKSTTDIAQVKLAVAYRWVPTGTSIPSDGSASDNEQVVQIATPSLVAGGAQAINITVPGVNSERAGGRYEPTVRIVPS